jgi:DNA polymerase-2
MPAGFILQPTYRFEGGRAVIHLYGRLDSGASFLLRDDRQVPRFHIPAADANRARALGGIEVREEPGWRTMDGRPVARVELARPADAPRARQRLLAAGVACFEADVRFAYRYLMDHGIRGALRIDGAARPGEHGGAVFDNPRIEPCSWAPRLRVLCLDIETDPRADRLLSIGLSGCGADEVLLLTPPGASCPAGAVPFQREEELLRALADRVEALDPDVLTGWNVVGFDLATLERCAVRRRQPLRLGRGPEPLRLRPGPAPRGGREAVIPGRLVMDGIDLLRGAFVRLESYALDHAARHILGRGKTMHGPGRVNQILHAFHHDRPAFVEYNLQDARLVLDILDTLQLVELSVERSLLTGMPPDRVAASIASFDFLYLSALRARRVVAPSVAADARWNPGPGGHVLDPEPGLHRNVIVLDFRSLYPSIIRTFQIDPLGHAAAAHEPDAIVAPSGARFSRCPGILPGLLDELAPRREAALAAGDRVASHAIKILMNSCYGVLGTPACRFGAPALAGAITSFGRSILLWCKSWLEDRGERVIYGDTDSLFIRSGLEDAGRAAGHGAGLARALTADLAAHVRRTWDLESRLELKFEKLYLRLLLPALRHGTAGARKRYAGLLQAEGAAPRVEFTGMEAVRRDWTALARTVQRELYRRYFLEQPVEAYLRGVVADLRAGRLDQTLVYRKGRRRRLESYTATTPPHVAAARKMRGRAGRVIAYVMTSAGPEPLSERSAPIDHEHYVQKQVRPVAEPVLAQLGLEFDRVVGDDAQLRLF